MCVQKMKEKRLVLPTALYRKRGQDHLLQRREDQLSEQVVKVRCPAGTGD